MINDGIGFACVVWVILELLKHRWLTKLLGEKWNLFLLRFGCTKCISFWLTLIITCSIFTASIAAVIAIIIETILENKTTRI